MVLIALLATRLWYTLAASTATTCPETRPKCPGCPCGMRAARAHVVEAAEIQGAGAKAMLRGASAMAAEPAANSKYNRHTTTLLRLQKPIDCFGGLGAE